MRGSSPRSIAAANGKTTKMRARIEPIIGRDGAGRNETRIRADAGSARVHSISGGAPEPERGTATARR